MVEAAALYADGFGEVLHGGGVIAALPEKVNRGGDKFLVLWARKSLCHASLPNVR
jgi:hypothetical protein